MISADINSVLLKSGSDKVEILNNMTFNTDERKVYCILGKNGSGKSTLIKSLTGLLPQDKYIVKGKVFFKGIDLLNCSEENILQVRKNNIRYVFQDAVNSFDPLKKLKYYFDSAGSEVKKIRQLLHYFLLPSFEKLILLYPYEISGGMAQRLLLVLALLADPDIIILDEPTSGVDNAISNLLLLMLREFSDSPGKSVIVVTQDINFALKSSDYISYLSNRTLSKFYSTEEFLSIKEDNELNNFLTSFKELKNEPV